MSDFEKDQFQKHPHLKFESLQKATKGAAKDLLATHAWSHTLIFAGPGGNGADGFGLARLLKEAGWDPLVVYTESTSEFREKMAMSALSYGVSLLPLKQFLEHFHWKELSWSLIIDGFLGIQAKGNLNPDIQQALEWANNQNSYRIALDCPTGWQSPRETVFKASLTYCFHTVKKELLSREVRPFCCHFKVIDVGFKDPCLGPQIFTGNPSEVLPKADPTWHKYKRGSVYLGVGSALYTGSAKLAEEALWHHYPHLGPLAGMVYTLTPPSCAQSVLWDLSPCKGKPNALVIGSGMSVKNEYLPRLFDIASDVETAVLDAAALDYIKAHPQTLKNLKAPNIVLTPHEGEARRLLAADQTVNFEELCLLAKQFAQTNKVWFLLKSYVSYLWGPEGQYWIEPFAEASLAVAGSGDKLAALIGATSLHLPIEKAILVACRLQVT